MTTTTQLALTHLEEGQGSPEVTINDALGILDAVIQLTVIDRHLTAPPGSPSEGDRYIPAATATGDWAGHENKIAVYISGWVFFTPSIGWQCYVVDEYAPLVFTASGWAGMQYETGITAHADGTQAAGYILSRKLSIVVTIAGANDSVTLPDPYIGQRMTVFNEHASLACKVFPKLNGEIRPLGVNAGRGCNAGNSLDFIGVSALNWTLV